jgi:hypothetical protein
MGLGYLLGGAAEGIQTGIRAKQDQEEIALRNKTIMQDDRLRTRAMDIQEQSLKREEQQDLLSQADKIIGDQLKIVSEVVKHGKEAGRTPEQIAATVEPILVDVDNLSKRAGRDGSVYRRQVEAMLTMPTAVEAAASEGTAEAAKSKAMTAAGVSTDNVVETIKLKIARGDQLTPGEERLYQDSVHKTGNALAEALKPFLEGSDGASEAAPAATPKASVAAPEPRTPPVPASLVSKKPKWSPSKQRWFTLDGASYNEQGVPK